MVRKRRGRAPLLSRDLKFARQLLFVKEGREHLPPLCRLNISLLVLEICHHLNVSYNFLF